MLAAAGAGADPGQVAFSGSYSGTVSLGVGTIDFAADGTATYLGKSSIKGSASITGITSSCAGGFTVSGAFIATATSGDGLNFTFDEVDCPTSSPGSYDGTGTYKITGGAGRFTGATGAGSSDSPSNLLNQTFGVTVTGTVSRPVGASPGIAPGASTPAATALPNRSAGAFGIAGGQAAGLLTSTLAMILLWQIRRRDPLDRSSAMSVTRHASETPCTATPAPGARRSMRC